MKVLLISVDGKKPNLALMKISEFHKKRGDSVELRKCFCGMLGLPHPNPDKVYVSCIFTKNAPFASNLSKMFDCEVEVGGYGINDKQLPYEIEHIMPDYSLYGIHYSIGFTSRGCIRSCPWCIVPEKEGKIREHALIDEFYVPKWHKLILWDNNFLASPNWEKNLHEITARKIRICFNQGLDIRLIDASTAKLLSKTHYCDDQFKRPRLYFAFDLPNIEGAVVEGIEILKKAGIKARHLMFYVLVGFNTSFEEDYHRFELLDKLGVKPYIMLYNDRKDRPILRRFERWVNGRYYNVCKWKDYKP